MSNAVAQQGQPSPAQMVEVYKQVLVEKLPSQFRDKQQQRRWLNLARSALKKGEKVRDGLTKLEIAAANNPVGFLSVLNEAAYRGLTPGTEEFYLTTRKNKGVDEIQGIIGYQGLIELIYRAGAVKSIKCEPVYSNDDFDYSPTDDYPTHRVDWFSEDRGELKAVYAYAILKDGSYSKVVVLTKKKIEEIKKSSQGANSEFSPWRKQPEAMWMKSAIRQLAKWVPTSAEKVTEGQEPKKQPGLVDDVHIAPPLKAPALTVAPAALETATAPTPEPETTYQVDTATGELVDEEARWEAMAEERSA